MKGELWQIITEHEPNEDQVIWFAKLQEYIDDRRQEIYGQNIDYAHFMERKDSFHEQLRKQVRLVYKQKTMMWNE